eukprot:CAMPEP_0172401748 /NCGR_PEP_ID=MMETSP1061-20121228/51732_1 /TAXON_ID=37318 /ORGANISM="Pseudo-nitzschia pungens, Strain cf. pungens" /LENGTH=49 /DNA_ID= /DNA_START= /DNA_END= /DNA_ORIENTATION=
MTNSDGIEQNGSVVYHFGGINHPIVVVGQTPVANFSTLSNAQEDGVDGR